MVTPNDLSFDATGRVLPATSTVVMMAADQSRAGVPTNTTSAIVHAMHTRRAVKMLYQINFSLKDEQLDILNMVVTMQRTLFEFAFANWFQQEHDACFSAVDS